MQKVAQLFKSIPYVISPDCIFKCKLEVSEGITLTKFKISLSFVIIYVTNYILQLSLNWNFISTVARLESIFFICVMSLGVCLQVALLTVKQLYSRLVRELESFEIRNNRK